jgi:hypothetical protein
MKNAICCWREPLRMGQREAQSQRCLSLDAESMTRGYWTGTHLPTKKGPDWRPSGPHRCKGIQYLGTDWRCGPPLRRGRVGRRQRNGSAGITTNRRHGNSSRYRLENRSWRGARMKDTIGRLSIGWKETDSGWEHGRGGRAFRNMVTFRDEWRSPDEN